MTTGSQNRPRDRLRPILRGFTLIELVMVIGIITILASMAVPRFSASLLRRRVDAAARRVVSDLNLARRYARQSSTARSVSVNVAGGSFVLVGLADPDHPGTHYVVHLDQRPYEVRIASANFGGDTAIIFDGYGAPDSGGTVVLGAGTEYRSISVDASSGQATVTTVPEPALPAS